MEHAEVDTGEYRGAISISQNQDQALETTEGDVTRRDCHHLD